MQYVVVVATAVIISIILIATGLFFAVPVALILAGLALLVLGRKRILNTTLPSGAAGAGTPSTAEASYDPTGASLQDPGRGATPGQARPTAPSGTPDHSA